MRPLLVILACASVFAAPAFAGTCGPDQDDDIALLETAKAALLNADYRSFVNVAGPYFSDLEENYDSFFGPLESTFPDGFDRCVTVL